MPKRTNIRRRGNSWVVHYRRDGRQVWRSFKTRDEAELELARAMVRKAQGQQEPTARRTTLAEFAVEWLDYKKGRIGEQTYVNYSNVLAVHVLPSLGTLELRKITRETLDRFVSDWSAAGPMFQDRVRLAQERERERAMKERRRPRPIRVGRSPKTIGNAIVVLGNTFKIAAEWHRIAASPAVGLERPRDARPDNELMHPLDMDGISALTHAAGEGLPRTLLLTAAMTGMRRGELLGLRWGDLDYANGRVWVRRSIGLRGVVQKPKTKKSVRAVSLSKPLRDALEMWWKQSDYRAETDYVFPSSTGSPLDARNMIREVFEPARKQAGLGRVRFHDLRHSFASILIAEGEHPKAISEQLGHASIAITMDRYSHLFDRSYSDVSDALERAWTASGPASAEGQNGAVSFHADAAAPEAIPVDKAA